MNCVNVRVWKRHMAITLITFSPTTILPLYSQQQKRNLKPLNVVFLNIFLYRSAQCLQARIQRGCQGARAPPVRSYNYKI